MSVVSCQFKGVGAQGRERGAGFFADERAERRDVPLAIQRLGMWTFDVRAADLERPEGVDRLMRAVRASDEEPGYFFVVVGGHETTTRFYPFRVR